MFTKCIYRFYLLQRTQVQVWFSKASIQFSNYRSLISFNVKGKYPLRHQWVKRFKSWDTSLFCVCVSDSQQITPGNTTRTHVRKQTCACQPTMTDQTHHPTFVFFHNCTYSKNQLLVSFLNLGCASPKVLWFRIIKWEAIIVNTLLSLSCDGQSTTMLEGNITPFH